MRDTSLPRPTRTPRAWTKALSVILGAAVLGLLVWAGSKVDWQEVWHAVKRLPPSTLWMAAAVGACSHAIYATYDLLGRAWIGHRVPIARVMQTTFISYAFNLNLGSLIGGFAFRFRLYSRLGLRKAEIGKVLALSLATNWLGYAALMGTAFLFGWLKPPDDWTLSASALPWLGGLLWLIAAGYVALCWGSKRRSFRVRGHVIHLPPGRLALAQLVMSSINWLTIAATVWILLQQAVPYPQVLAALLAAAVAGVVTHIPAGIGVLEGVFLALLAPTIPAATLLAALLAYRALYYLLPLLPATALYFVVESRPAAA